jgi:tetratricopeptide (TPR) repeat protein
MESSADIYELLVPLSGLRGAGAAKSRFLTALDRDYGQKLLSAVKDLEQGISLQAPAGQGIFDLAVSGAEESSDGRRIFLRRSFPGDGSLVNYVFVLKSTSGGLDVTWVAPDTRKPLGIRTSSQGPVFLFEDSEGCRGLALLGDGGPVYEGCPAGLLGMDIVEEHPAIVDAVAGGDGPVFYRRGRIENGGLAAEETSLERALRLFEEGQYEAAAKAFEEATREIDPVAPYDEVDIRYNQARCLEAQGKIREALILFESIGDVAYQALVDERIHVLSSGGPR